jgi:glycogen debranching enzyme
MHYREEGFSRTLHVQFGEAVLEPLARLQGTKIDPWTDEEPGRIPHELRHDELTGLGKLFFRGYYGTVDASLLYVVLVHELFRFTLDRALLERFSAPAATCQE